MEYGSPGDGGDSGWPAPRHLVLDGAPHATFPPSLSPSPLLAPTRSHQSGSAACLFDQLTIGDTHTHTDGREKTTQMIKAWKNFFLGKDRRARVVSFLDPGKEGRKQVGRRLLQGGCRGPGSLFPRGLYCTRSCQVGSSTDEGLEAQRGTKSC